ncbi:hypothetical protein [Croceimicrobium hydrocarbonivorans]|uniref:Uncharacterized protein n=1 Tax=Croceimicrobium hydrocarbonivorans TaxID=2761580 RepID=A0A7H0VF34_9FLAO|nr:hypothetical protein [Croceimicrobium hydrocarbonivorans]QNR24332.1 hypothetical protein H4K34_00410 [Croceimicrobium hydrocarbonivorans]
MTEKERILMLSGLALVITAIYIKSKWIDKQRRLADANSYLFETNNYLTEYIQGLSRHFSNKILGRSLDLKGAEKFDDTVEIPSYPFLVDPDKIELKDLILYLYQVIREELHCMTLGKSFFSTYIAPPPLHLHPQIKYKGIDRENAWMYLNRKVEFLILELYYHRLKNGRMTENADLIIAYEWVSINQHWHGEGNFFGADIEHFTLDSLIDLENKNFEVDPDEFFFEICSGARIDRDQFAEEIKPHFRGLIN